jgi:small subunit ribosomal protein S3
MSQVSHPYSQRLIILRDWKSRWFAVGKKYRDFLRGDVLLREFLHKRLRGNYVASIDIERSRKSMRVAIATSRPGMVIGRSGENMIRLKSDIMKEMKRKKLPIPEEFNIDIVEVKEPDANAAIVAQMSAEALEKRMPFRRVMKQTAEKVMTIKGVQGFKMTLSGRLGGAEMARVEKIKRGSTPLQFLRGDVDYTTEKAHLPYGDIGIKVWIYKGDSLEKKEDNA